MHDIGVLWLFNEIVSIYTLVFHVYYNTICVMNWCRLLSHLLKYFVPLFCVAIYNKLVMVMQPLALSS